MDGEDGEIPADSNEQEENGEFRIGQGRAEPCWETPSSYRQVYRVGQDATQPLMILAIDVLFEEGHEALSEHGLVQAYDHWTYDEMDSYIHETLNEDQEVGFKAVLERAVDRLFTGPLPSAKVFERKVVDVIRRYRFAVSTLLHAGIMSHRFGVYLHSHYRARKRYYYEQFFVWFGDVAERKLMERCATRHHLWLVFALHRQLQVFRRYYQALMQPARLELLALLHVPIEQLQYGSLIGLEQVLATYFGARLTPDPSNPHGFLCFPPD